MSINRECELKELKLEEGECLLRKTLVFFFKFSNKEVTKVKVSIV